MSEFQIGDVVKVTGNRGKDGNGTTHYFEDGVIATVRMDKDSDGDYFVTDYKTDYDESGVLTSQFVNEHNLERLPFQVGDKVLVRNGGGLGAFDGEPTKAEVIAFGGWMGDSIEDRRHVVALDDPDWTQVALVRDMEMLPLFEEGDKVRIIGNGDRENGRIEHYLDLGDRGVVVGDRDYDGDYLVEVDDTENYVHESHLEKVEETGEKNDGPEERPCKYGGTCTLCDEPEPEPEPEPEFEKEFEIGTRVRVVNAGQANNAEDGDTGVVEDKPYGHLAGRVLHSVRLDRTGEVSKLFGYRLEAQPFEQGEVEKVTEALKEGDRVRIIANLPTRGGVGTLKPNEEGTFYPYRVEGVGAMGYVAVHGHEVEKVEDEDKPSTYPLLDLSAFTVSGPLSFADVSVAGGALDVVNHPPTTTITISITVSGENVEVKVV